MKQDNIPTLKVKVGGEFTIEKFKADGTVTHSSHHKNMLLDQGFQTLLTATSGLTGPSSFVVAFGGGGTPVDPSDTDLEIPLFMSSQGSGPSASLQKVEEISPGVFKFSLPGTYTTALGVLPGGGEIKEIGLRRYPSPESGPLFTRAVLDTPVQLEGDEGVRVVYSTYSILDSSIMELGEIDGYTIRAAFRGSDLLDGRSPTFSFRSFPQPYSSISGSASAAGTQALSDTPNSYPSMNSVGNSGSRTRISGTNSIRYTFNSGIQRTTNIRTLTISSPALSTSTNANLVFEFTPAIVKTADNTFQFVYDVAFERD